MRPSERTVRSTPLKVLLAPRNEENPYLPQLRAALESQGITVEWFESEFTNSQTLNAILAPFELWKCRRNGFEVLHLHWVYKFRWPAVAEIPVLRRVPRFWFGCFLVLARSMGFTIVYTWHDLVPVVTAFDNDAKSRMSMRRRLDGIIAITEAAKRDIARTFDVPAEMIAVVPEGPPPVDRVVDRTSARAELGVDVDTVLIAAFGHIQEYKGLDVLLEALRRLPADLRFAVRILGAAADPAYATRMDELVGSLRDAGRDVSWTRRVFTDDELGTLLSATDVVALPFRRITNSATLRFSMAWGATVVLPRLAALDDIPEEAAAWCAPGDPDDLARTLEALLREWPGGANASREAATRWVSEWSWEAVGAATLRVYAEALERRHAA